MAEIKQGSKVVDGQTASQAADSGMKKAAQNTNGLNGDQKRIKDLQSRYNEERDKRLRPDGLGQYIDVYDSPKFRHFQEDPWADSEPKSSNPRVVKDGEETRFLIMGAGFAGVCAAVRLRLSGVPADDIIMVDSAGGFGGTWYWNRYPGLACDLESYMYLPFLEQTGYIPKNKYSYGPEIRDYINLVVDKYDLRRNALFQAEVKESNWDEDRKRWVTRIQPTRQQEPYHVISQYTVLGPGVLSLPKIPDVPGLEEFKGKMFHTSRWDYGLTGGTELQPDMEDLKDKRVAILGTGATAIQVVPQLAKWAKKLYVIQRTPSGVDWRGQHETDPEIFKREVANRENWQYHRHMNFTEWSSNYPDVPKVNLVNDAWTNVPAFKPFCGGTGAPTDPAKIGEFIEHLHELDIDRGERVRKRVDEIVKDPATADKLKPWYPSWCKRPTFNDFYLPVFNQDNVELVDTAGKGVTALTETGFKVNERDFQADVFILGTGYRSPGTSICKRANLKVKGRGGLDLDEKYEKGWSSLHGVLSKDFPNMFIFQLSQWAAGTNYTSLVDRMAEHTAHIVKTAEGKTATGERSQLVIEPTAEAENAWGDLIVKNASVFAPLAACTPGYYNAEGGSKDMSPEEQKAAARKAPWGLGWPAFVKVIEAWESDGKLEGLTLSV